jgi:hypothetical protein
MTSLNLASIQFFKKKSLSHRFTVTGLPVHQSTVISLQSSVTSSPVYQFSTHNSLLNHYTTTPLYDYTSLPFTTHHSLLIAALGLIEFSIQWLWSIATNPSLELTGTTHHSPLTTKPLHHYTTIRSHQSTSSRLTTHDSPLTTLHSPLTTTLLPH